MREVDIGRILEAEQNPRNRLLFEVLVRTGLKVSEVVALRVSDVMAIGYPRAKIRNHKPGNHTRTLRRLISLRDDLSASIIAAASLRASSEPLFPSRKGGSITKSRADGIVREMGRRAGMSINPGDLRSYFVADCTRRLGPLAAAEEMAFSGIGSLDCHIRKARP